MTSKIVAFCLLIVVAFCSQAADKKLSPESQKFLDDFKAFASEKTKLSVEVSSLLMAEITSNWQLKLDSDKSIESFINACIAGYYDDTASKKIGALLVSENKITKNQYSMLRNKCIGGNGVLMKTKFIWQKLINNSRIKNLPLSTLIE